MPEYSQLIVQLICQATNIWLTKVFFMICSMGELLNGLSGFILYVGSYTIVLWLMSSFSSKKLKGSHDLLRPLLTDDLCLDSAARSGHKNSCIRVCIEDRFAYQRVLDHNYTLGSLFLSGVGLNVGIQALCLLSLILASHDWRPVAEQPLYFCHMAIDQSDCLL